MSPMQLRQLARELGVELTNEFVESVTTELKLVDLVNEALELTKVQIQETKISKIRKSEIRKSG